LHGSAKTYSGIVLRDGTDEERKEREKESELHLDGRINEIRNFGYGGRCVFKKGRNGSMAQTPATPPLPRTTHSLRERSAATTSPASHIKARLLLLFNCQYVLIS
jgi:hypothetical protein